MESIKLISSVSEPELDMNRRRGQMAGGKMRRLLSSILGYQDAYSMGTPRRSIDRELQQYSPSYEW